MLLTTVADVQAAHQDGTPTLSPPANEQADPSFAALPGATAYFGRLAGSAYQIGIPDAWNGRLALLLHRFGCATPAAAPPPNRDTLIRSRTAWAASNYRTTGPIATAAP